MSASETGRTADAIALSRQRRMGLRVAFAVSLGFTVAVANGAIVPFLGPLFAAQFLLSSSRPLPVGKTLGAAVLILVAGIFFMVLTGLLDEKPVTLLLLLGLSYFLLFFAQATGKGGAAIFLVQVVAIIVPLLGILNRTLAESILSILVTGVVSGTLLMWLAYALIPESDEVAVQLEEPALTTHPYWRALANTAILLSAVTICLTNDQLSAAMVIPITVASLLGQLDIVRSGRAAAGLIIINLLGGVIASVAYALLSLRPNLFAMAVILLVVSLLLGGRAASRSPEAKMFAGALTTFLILFGLGVSPLPGSAAESFATRILFVAAAIAFTFVFALLLWPRAASQPPPDQPQSRAEGMAHGPA